jgi:hypothetical protein
MTWRRLVLLDGALLGLAILASRAALLLHEVVGHGLTSLALGAQGFTLKLSLLGGGYVLPTNLRASGAGYAFFALGGIAVNLLTGAAAWIIARRLRRRGLLYAFLLMLGAGSIGQALFYLATGFYYGEGDPEGFTGRPRGDLSHLQWMWLLFPLPFAAAAAWSAKGWLDFLAGYAPVDTPRRRAGWVVATVGVVTVAYFGLWFATWDARVDVTMRSQRRQTEFVKLKEEKAREASRRPPPPPPPATTPAPPAPPPAPPPPPVVTPEEVEARVPAPIAGITMLAVGLLAAGVVVLRRTPPPSEPATLSPLAAAIPMALAAAALGAIVWLGR